MNPIGHLPWAVHPHTARVLMALFCGLQGVATIVLDLNRTHATHPRWLGHARFHVVWQTCTIAVLSAFSAFLALAGGPLERDRFYLAASLAAMPMIGFFCALLSRRLYGGTLSDPGGIPPLRISVRGLRLSVDMNLVAEVAGLITVAVIVLMY